jgi:hypothetical protein
MTNFKLVASLTPISLPVMVLSSKLLLKLIGGGGMTIYLNE